MAIRVVRLGTPRHRGEGLRLGTVRHPPRGVPKRAYASRNYYDLWLPELAPNAALVSWFRAGPATPGRWKTFAQRYRREMRAPGTERLITLLAALSAQASFSVGCYCEDETYCHRSLLKQLLAEHRAKVA